MLQDIYPAQLKIEYESKKPYEGAALIAFNGENALLRQDNDEFFLPCVSEFYEYREKMRFLFKINDEDFFLLDLDDECPVPDGCCFKDMQYFRRAKPQYKAFAVVTALHINKFYTSCRYCGGCAAKLKHSESERAMCCPSCGRTFYPQIAPSIIVAVTDGDRLLLTKYNSAHNAYKKYTLVAGYCETGESAEQTVRREVMEEVGLRVKNIRYYKSQPWGFTGTLLLGYFAELDGSDKVTVDESELSRAQWFSRSEIPKSDSDISLTNEMIEYFRNN